MKKQSASTFINVADLKLRVAEHIVTQNDCYRTADVQTILAETKVGAWRQADLLKKLKMIFSA
ncbi:unnamed protein product, partial [marine sediment metagenome]